MCNCNGVKGCIILVSALLLLAELFVFFYIEGNPFLIKATGLLSEADGLPNQTSSLHSGIIHFHLIFTHFDQKTMKKNVSHQSILNFRTVPNDAYAHLYSHRHRRVLESIFYHHRNVTVTIHTNFMTMKDFESFTDKGYAIKIRQLEFSKLSKSTPLEGVEHQARFRKWEESQYWYTSFSNIYRLLVLYQEGGVYIDSDIVVTRPFDDLDNVLGWQDKTYANNAVLVFKKPGNAFVFDCLLEMNSAYSTTGWGNNGPKLVTRVWLRQWKDRGNASNSVRVLSQESFYLFPYQKLALHCFSNGSPKSELLRYATALAGRVPHAVHTNNKITGRGKTALRNGTLCHYLFTRFCVLCQEEPARPASYPNVEAGNATVALP
jgi:hypothetical protein